MRSSHVAVLVALPLLVGATSASATTFSYGSYSVANEQNISITQPNAVSGGMGQITLNGSGFNIGQTITAWCLDVYTYLSNTGSYQTSTLTTAGAGGSNPSLTSTQINQIGSLMSHATAAISSSAYASAAIQLAIWKTEYSNFSATGVDSNVSSLASTYLTNVGNGGAWNVFSGSVTLLQQSGNQTLGYVSGSGTELNPTPLPSTLTMMLGALSLFGFVGLVRRTKRFGLTTA